MINRLKQLIKVIGVLCFSIFILVGCSKEKPREFVNSYTRLWNEGNYELLYDNLSKESKEYISKEDFVKRYNNIYPSIGINNIRFDIKESKDDLKIPVSIKMNSFAGELSFDNVGLNLIKEDKKYKIVWDENLIIPGMIKGDKVRIKITNGTRGNILDKDDNLLAYDGYVNSINVHPKVFEENKEENILKMAEILDYREDFINSKLDDVNPDNLIEIVKIANYEQEKVDLLKAIPGVSINKVTSRVYAQGEAFGSLLGYIGNITQEKLEKNIDKGYTPYSKIGITGLEQVYEDKLRAKEGIHIYIERGKEKLTLKNIEPKNGENIKLSIDSKLQEDIYLNMNGEKGASVAMDPISGNVVAMVSSPSYDSNTLVTYKTKTIDNLWKESERSQFLNRVNDRYSPGSTMKLITAAIGLESGVIDPNEKMDIQGLNWQNNSNWGDYRVTRVKDPNKPVDLYDATKYSDNIYFADKAIKIGEQNYIDGVKKFGIGEKLIFEYPMQKSQISNNGKLESEILLGDTGYGQGEVLLTPLDITMIYSALVNEGKIMEPRLVIREDNLEKVYKQAINPKHIEELQNCFLAVINDVDGTGNLAKIENINLVGKTGTAEIKNSKDDNTGSENGWFVAANIDNPKIAISMIIEDMKGQSSGEYVGVKVKKVIENYLNR